MKEAPGPGPTARLDASTVRVHVDAEAVVFFVRWIGDQNSFLRHAGLPNNAFHVYPFG